MKKVQKRPKTITTQGVDRKNNREINKVFKKVFTKYNIENFKTN
ncbi:hypothetical protein [Flavobacterium psychroterrae]|nr:hypothetical protein [Flavobacterium psychroterrae]